MVKAHSPINWQNYPSIATPINEANLNKMDSTIGILDDRIVELDTKRQQMEDQISEAEKGITENTSDIEILYNEQDDMMLEVKNIKESVSNNATEISNIKEEVSELPTAKTTTETTITDSADAPVIYLKVDGYTEQDGTPTPDAPIHVDGLGDKGYFDGELRQGYFNVTTGVFVSSNYFVSNMNKILCNANDTLVAEYEDNISSFTIVFFDEDGAFISSAGEKGETISINKLECIAPINASYFYVQVGYYGATQELLISTTKHISVTINGRYALQVETTNEDGTESNKAIIPIDNPLYDGDYIEVYADGSGKIVRKNASVLIDGSKNPVAIGDGVDCKRASYNLELKSGHGGTYRTLASNRFVPLRTGVQYTGMVAGEMIYVFMGSNDFSGRGRLMLAVPTEYNTKALVQEYFTEHPTYVVYPLMTPTETPLTAEQIEQFKKLRTFNEVTNINADGTTTVRYYVNTDSGETVGMLQEMVEDLDEVEVANSVYATTGSGGGGETKKKYTFDVGSNQDPTTKILTGSGDGSVFALTNPSELNVGGAEKDGNGNIIADTYLTGFTQLGLVNASGGVASSTLDIDISEYKTIALSVLSYYNVNIWGSILAPKSLINDGSMYPTTIRCTCYGPDDVLLKATYNANTKVLSLDPGTCSYSLMAYLHGLK